MYNLTLVLKQKDYKVNCFAKRILRSAVSFEKYQTSSLGSSSAWFSCALQLVRFSGIPFYNSKSRWRYFCMKQKSCVQFLKIGSPYSASNPFKVLMMETILFSVNWKFSSSSTLISTSPRSFTSLAKKLKAELLT